MLGQTFSFFETASGTQPEGQQWASGRVASATPSAPPLAARIAIVLHDFSSGGTEHVAVRLANAWAAAGRQVTIFCGSEAGPLRQAVAAGVQVSPAPQPCPRAPGSRLRLGRALAQFVARAPHEIVFAPGNYHLPVLAKFASAGTSGATTVCKLSNPMRLPTRGRIAQSIHDAAWRRMAAGIDCLVAMSPALRDEARAALHRDDIAMAWEPILADAPAPAVAPRQAAETGAAPLILCIGRLERQKNFELALEAFARSAARHRAELVFLGEGSRRTALIERARALGIAERVRMPGYRGAILADLSRASALLLTSRFEGYPAVLVEAIGAGTPVIATPCSPAIGEIVAGCPASMVVPHDSGSIAVAIDRMLRNEAAPRPSYSGTLLARHGVAHAAKAYLSILDAARFRAARSGT